MIHYKMYIDGKWEGSASVKPVYEKYTGEEYAVYAESTPEDVDRAVASAKESFRKDALTPTQRHDILMRTAEILKEMQEEIAQSICHEAGRTIEDSRYEVLRAVGSFQLSAEEGRRIAGEMIPAEGIAGDEDKMCFTVRKPIGVVAAIMPFNVPLVLTVNKIAPAIAAGNTIVLKPTKDCPGHAVLLVKALLKAGLPANHVQLVLGPGSTVGEALLKNQDIACYCFTGSLEMGTHVRNSVGLRRCLMDLGNNGGVIIHKDVDVKDVAITCAATGFTNAGQLCIKPQRLYVHEDIVDEFVQAMKEYAESVAVGDPADEKTMIGPMISEKEVDRIDAWVKEAQAGGAVVVCGGEKISPRVYQPTILTNVTKDMKVVSNEAFAPLVVVIPYKDFDDAIDQLNDSKYGLHAAAFTNDFNLALRATQKIEAGGVIINGSTYTHIPVMPFGGIKNSGVGGKEGPRYCIEEMTDVKTIIYYMK